ncbi:MAG: hypothetical protein ACI845_002749 [Gammaproteobacteria bacterium]|jgi:hypothetical protein
MQIPKISKARPSSIMGNSYNTINGCYDSGECDLRQLTDAKESFETPERDLPDSPSALTCHLN